MRSDHRRTALFDNSRWLWVVFRVASEENASDYIHIQTTHRELIKGSLSLPASEWGGTLVVWRLSGSVVLINCWWLNDGLLFFVCNWKETEIGPNSVFARCIDVWGYDCMIHFKLSQLHNSYYVDGVQRIYMHQCVSCCVLQIACLWRCLWWHVTAIFCLGPHINKCQKCCAGLGADLMHCWIGELTPDSDTTLQLVLRQHGQSAKRQPDFDRHAVVISAGHH